MNPNIENSLQQAFSLIEAGRLEDARSLLRPILEVEKDNADVWWLYSHAVIDSETAKLALYNVLRVEPQYPDARDLLDQLDKINLGNNIEGISDDSKDPDFIPPIPTRVPNITPLSPRNLSETSLSPDALPEDLGEYETPDAFFRRPAFYVPLVVALIVLALIIVIAKPFANTSLPAPTQIVATNSDDNLTPTGELLNNSTITVSPSAEVAVVPQAVSDFAPIISAFAGTNLQPNSPVAIVNTSLGKTLTVIICSSPGKEMRELLPVAMSTLAKASNEYSSKVDAIAVKMIVCDSNTILLWIGSNIADAMSYANSSLSEKDYQSKWKPAK